MDPPFIEAAIWRSVYISNSPVCPLARFALLFCDALALQQNDHVCQMGASTLSAVAPAFLREIHGP